MKNILKFIEIIDDSRIPKYKQIVDSVVYNIGIGNFLIEQKMPSINQMSEEFYLSRDTVEKAYNILKDKKIILAIKGKGYYIARTKLLAKQNILFLINKSSTYKMSIYNSLVNALGVGSHVDMQIYHCDQTLFLNLMMKFEKMYDYYVIMPHFNSNENQHISESAEILIALEKIPKNKLLILDNNEINLKGDYSQVFQDFENDIYHALSEGYEKISKYKKLFLVYPKNTFYPYPKKIIQGFRKFCIENNIVFEIIEDIFEDIVLIKGDLFITIEESDLVNLVNSIREMEFVMGEDIGVISYNETPLKELLGITVISTNFKSMGETAAQLILNNEIMKIKNPFRLIDRKSM